MKTFRPIATNLTILFLSLIISITSLGQTKQETIAWLNSKSNHQFVYGDFFKASQKMKIFSDGTFEITHINYEVPFNPMKPEAMCTITAKGNFKNLSPSSVTWRKSNGLIFIDINCTDGSNCIKTSKTGTCGIELDTSGITFGAFDDAEENIGARLKKAFVHLINLCGGKKEPF